MYNGAVATEDPYTGTVKKDHAAYARQWLIDNNYDEDFEVVIAKDNELLLDYDCTTLPEQFDVAMGILCSTLWGSESTNVVLSHKVSYSKSGHIHVVVALPHSIPIVERIAWQAAFGSDPKREALHLLSIARGDDNPILLYQRKDKATLLLGDGGNCATGQPDKSAS